MNRKKQDIERGNIMMCCRSCGAVTSSPGADQHGSPIHWLFPLLMAIGLVGAVVAFVAGSLLIFGGASPITPATPTPTITTTSTSTATPTPTSTPTPEPVVYRVTYYGAAFQGGPVYCGTGIYGPFDMHDPTTAASGEGGPPCGTHLRLCSEAACQPVIIKDACGGCGPYHLDLSKAAWEVLGQPTHVEAQLLRAANPPDPPATVLTGGDFASLPLPGNVTVRYDGCASNGACYPFNFYYAPTHEVVLVDASQLGARQETHEWCHAHQHWSINGGAPLAPSDYDLESWYSTAEGQGFTAAVAGLTWPWNHSAVNGLEDFAWTCANWYADPGHLRASSPERYEWARQNLPCGCNRTGNPAF